AVRWGGDRKDFILALSEEYAQRFANRTDVILQWLAANPKRIINLSQEVPDEFITLEMCTLAVRHDPHLLKYIPEKFQKHPAIQKLVADAPKPDKDKQLILRFWESADLDELTKQREWRWPSECSEYVGRVFELAVRDDPEALHHVCKLLGDPGHSLFLEH